MLLDRAVTDEDVERAISSIGVTQKQAEEKRRRLSKEEIHLLRARCKRDLFFLCSSVLGSTRLSVNLHGHLCEHIRRTDYTHRFREFLLPRGCFKTTIITIGHTIQLALPYTDFDRQHDPDTSDLPYPSQLGPDLRLLIAHETHESSARFLYAITNHFTNNALLMALFPEVVPSPRTNRINKWELELPRTITGNPEPTIDTLGVGGKSQGRHYNYIKLDDIYGDKARDSEAESETTRQWFDNIQSFFSLFSKDRLDLVGTRYSFDDIYAHAEERYGGQLSVYLRKIEEDDGNGGVKITFPEEFTPESLEILKKNKKIYESQYLNDPSQTGTGFSQDDRRFFSWLDRNRLAVFTGESKEIIDIRDLDIVILIDPGQSKSGGICITGMDWKRRIFILSAIRLELKPEQLTELVFKQALRWKPRTVGIESDFFMTVFKPYWEAEMRLKKQFFHISQVHTKKQQKNDRIAGLSNYAANHQIFMNQAQLELIEEWRVWGKSKNIHILDALAYGPELWRPGYAPGTRMDSNKPQEQTDDRDVLTGYSAY